MGYAPVPMATLEINVIHLVNVTQMGLLTSTVIPMGYAPVSMATLEINVIVVITITLGFLSVNLVNVIQMGLLT